ncbi:TPA: hypothetical protein ACSP2Y_002628 [Aeromonas veronii]
MMLRKHIHYRDILLVSTSDDKAYLDTIRYEYIICIFLLLRFNRRGCNQGAAASAFRQSPSARIYGNAAMKALAARAERVSCSCHDLVLQTVLSQI